jgi:predicted extracellular nuclease
VAIAAGLPLATVGGLVALPPAADAADTSTVFVNEFHYDNIGTDTGEFIEIAAPAGTDLTGWSLVLYNSEGSVPGQSYNTRALTGVIADQQGGYGTLSFSYPSNGIQNGPADGIALVRPGGTTVEQFLGYEGPFTATNGPAAGMTSEDIGVSQSSSEPVGSSLQLTGTGLTYGDFTWSATTANTAGQPNTGQVFDEPPPPPESDCDAPATACIHEIQGSGDAFDPVFGGVQTVQGVVTDVLLGGMHLQEEAADSDADPATSDGIFVFLGSRPAPSIGSTAVVTGTVAERFGMTQIGNVTRVEAVGAGTPIEPTDVTFPVSADLFLERYEGMLVRFPQHLVISEYFNYDRFGEIVAGVPPNGWDRFFNPTAVVEPGAPAQALAADYATRQITIDDRSNEENPAEIPHPGNGQPFSVENRFRGGDTITGIEGVLQFSFSAYRLHPTTYGTYTAVNPRPTIAPDVGGSVRVASANVLNYFLTLDQPGNLCGPAGNQQECRGANTAEELARQRAKVVANLASLDADVIGLMEMENTPGKEPARDLANGLNDIYGPGTYSYIDTGVIGTDAIRVGLLYRTDTVRPAGDFAILDQSVDPRFLDTKNRPMLTQTFDEILTGGRVTVSVNHLKSKGSDCDDVSDPDTGDGQGNCNLTRTAAAEAIVDFLATDPTNSGDPDHLVIGDLNSYDHEDPIDALVAGGYADQVKRFQGEFAYSYVFDGQSGYLDHALANRSLASQVTGAADRHINADEPDIFDYDMDFQPDPINALYEPNEFRSSDHDPVLIGLDLDSAPLLRCYLGERVDSYDPGRRADGSRVPILQRLPVLALGFPDGLAVTLGLDGEIVLRFRDPVQNNNGAAADLVVVDRSDGARGRDDSALVQASFDGVTWTDVGSVDGTGPVDLGLLAAAHYVRVVDTTEGDLLPTTDGYDLDGLWVRTGCV